MQTAVIQPAAINALLPLFLDSAHSVAMIKHSMEMVKTTVQYLNPGQTPILSADQLLYALAKQIQRVWPNDFGEDHFVLMLGGLHIEMAILKVNIYGYIHVHHTYTYVMHTYKTIHKYDVHNSNVLCTHHAISSTLENNYIYCKLRY